MYLNTCALLFAMFAHSDAANIADGVELPPTGSGVVRAWLHRTHQQLTAVAETRKEELSMWGTVLLLVLLACGWLYTSLTPKSKRPSMRTIEHRIDDSKRSIDQIIDTLKLIKLAHDNNVQCEQLIGEKLVASLKLGGGFSESASEAENQADNNVDEVIRLVRQEIQEICQSPPLNAHKPPIRMCNVGNEDTPPEYHSVQSETAGRSVVAKRLPPASRLPIKPGSGRGVHTKKTHTN